MENKFIALVVGLTVGVIMLSGFLWPVVADATATEHTFINDGMFNAKTIDETTEMTLTFDPMTDPNIITVDGVDIDMSNTPDTYGSVTVVFTDDWFARYVVSNGALAIYKCGTSSSSAIGGASVSNEQTLSMIISSGSATITFGETTLNYSVAGDGLAICPNKGDYVIKTATDTAYVNGDSTVYGVGRTDRALGPGTSSSFNAMVKATVDDGVTPIEYSPQYTWNDNRSVNATENRSYIDLYELTGFTFNLVDQSEEEHAVTYNQIFVPASVTAERSNHLDTTQIALVAAIGTLGAIVLIAAAAGSIRRLD